MKFIDCLVISSCYIYLFFFPLELEELFKLVSALDVGNVILYQGIILLKSLEIIFVMCFLMIISFYLLKRLVRLFLNFRALAKRNQIYLKVKIKLYEVAYPLNLKDAIFHFLVIIVYGFTIRNGLAYCMIISEIINQKEKKLDDSVNFYFPNEKKRNAEEVAKTMHRNTEEVMKEFEHMNQILSK